MATTFPDATTTGVPSDIVLKQSGSLVITTPGAVIEGLNITGSVIIDAPNVTLKNCIITDGGYDVVLIKPGITGAVVQNCEISNQGAGGQGIAGQGTFINNNIHDCADGIDVRGDNTVIQDNFIHNMRGTAGSHLDGIQADGGFSNLTIVHNTVINEQGQTSALMLDNYWGPINNVQIDNNLLIGGGYTVYLNEVANGQAGGGAVTNVTFTNNHLGSGTYGTLDLRTELGDQPTISGNVNDGYTLEQSLHLTGQPSSGSGTPTTGSTTPAAVAIAAFSQDTGVKGDGITKDSTLTLNGTAPANASVSVFDGTTKLGVALSNGAGAWAFTTAALADGTHGLVAKVTDSAGHTTASSVTGVTIDTVAPHSPTITEPASLNTISGGVTTVNHVTLAGAAEAGSSVNVMDGGAHLATISANGQGSWTYDATGLSNGSHAFTATATDVAGNLSAASSALSVSVDSATTPPSTNTSPTSTNTGWHHHHHGYAAAAASTTTSAAAVTAPTTRSSLDPNCGPNNGKLPLPPIRPPGLRKAARSKAASRRPRARRHLRPGYLCLRVALWQ